MGAELARAEGPRPDEGHNRGHNHTKKKRFKLKLRAMRAQIWTSPSLFYFFYIIYDIQMQVKRAEIFGIVASLLFFKCRYFHNILKRTNIYYFVGTGPIIYCSTNYLF